MPRTQPSAYQRTKEFLAAHAGEYFPSKAVMDALNLKSAVQRRGVGKSLSALASRKSIERRSNDEGRYEYAFTGEQANPEAPESAPKATKPRGTQLPKRKSARPAKKDKARLQPGHNEAAGSLRKVANFIRAYLDLSDQERREALEWIKEEFQ